MMTSIDEKFKMASENVKKIKKKPSNEILLQLYGLYKQATVGNINIPQPWALQVEKRAKWDSWKLFENMERGLAMTKYVEIVETLLSNN